MDYCHVSPTGRQKKDSQESFGNLNFTLNIKQKPTVLNLFPEKYVKHHWESNSKQHEKTDGFKHRHCYLEKHCHVDANMI